MSNSTIRIARICTVPMAYVHILKQLEFLANSPDYDLHLVTSRDDEVLAQLSLDRLNCSIHYVDFARDISLFKDIKTLWQLFFMFRKEKFSIVHSTTPKAGLLVAVSGFLARIPSRLHTFTGQRWVTLKGLKRRLLMSLDKLVSILNTNLYADSKSQAKFLIEQGIVKASKISVLGVGSLGGVDGVDSAIAAKKSRCADSFNFLFLGRIHEDKGIFDLLNAFIVLLNKSSKNLQLILVGPVELSSKNQLRFETFLSEYSHNIKHYGFTFNRERFFTEADLFCLPSYREGFGTVVVEAALHRVPTLGTNIVGLKDAIIDGETGVLVKVGDVNLLASQMEKLHLDQSLLADMGEKAYLRAVSAFSSNVLTDALIREYKELLDKR